MSAPKRILIVEDEVMISMHIEVTLAELGHTVLAAASQREVEALLDAEAINLAVIDYHLSDGTSAPLAARLTDRGVPFIICSGSAEAAELEEVFSGSLFLSKPFTTDHLIAAVSQLD